MNEIQSFHKKFSYKKFSSLYFIQSFLLKLIIINKSKMYYNPKSPRQNPNQTEQLTQGVKRPAELASPNKPTSPTNKMMTKNKEAPKKQINYEMFYKVLKLQNALLRIQLNNLNKFKGFLRIKQSKPFGSLSPRKKQTLERCLDMPEVLQNQLMERIQERVEMDKAQQRELLNLLISDCQSQRQRQLEAVLKFSYILKHKVNEKLNQSWKCLENILPDLLTMKKESSFNQLMERQKNIVNGFMILDKKFTQMKFQAWKKIDQYKYFGYKPVDSKKFSKKEKAQKLVNLNYLVKSQLKSAFSNWRISKTKTGKEQLSNLSDHLVLYSAIGRDNAFYRLLRLVRTKNYKTKLGAEKLEMIFNRRLQDGFDKIKEPYIIFLNCLQQLSDNIVLYSNVSVKAVFYRMMKGVVSNQGKNLNFTVSGDLKSLMASQRSPKGNMQQSSSPVKKKDLSKISKAYSVLFSQKK